MLKRHKLRFTLGHKMLWNFTQKVHIPINNQANAILSRKYSLSTEQHVLKGLVDITKYVVIDNER